MSCPRGWRPPPAPVVAANRARMLELLRRAARTPDARITSWYRDHATNQACGGAANSAHLRGLAFDVQPYRDRRGFIAACRAAGLRVIDEGDHLHVDLG